MTKKINIIIADDHKLFSLGLSALFADVDEINLVASVSNGLEVLEVLKNNTADIILSDIDMPQMDGLKLTKELKKSYPSIKILALTMHNEGRIISSLIKAGVSGYVLKDTGKDELLLAIKTVASGNNYFSEEVKTSLTESIIPGKKGNKSSSLIELSEREIEVLKYLSAGLTQTQISEKIFISEHTVIFHKRKLFSKFNVNNSAGLIKSAMEHGFL